VDEGGMLTAVSTGSAKITVTMVSTGKTATLTAKAFENANVVTTTLKTTNVGLNVGKNTTLKASAQLMDEEGKIRKDKPISSEVTWTFDPYDIVTEDPDGIAKVDAKGKVTALAEGITTLYAVAKCGTPDCEPLAFTVYVTPVLKSFTLIDPMTGKTASTIYLDADQGTKELYDYISINWKDGEGHPRFEDVTYQSDKPAIVEVDDYGTLTALSAGSAKITVTMVSTGKTAALTVKTGNAADFVNPATSTKVSLKVGRSTTLKATAGIWDETTGKASTKVKPVTNGVYWESDDENVATVDPASGKVTAVGEGVCTVTAYAVVGTDTAYLEFEITVTGN